MIFARIVNHAEALPLWLARMRRNDPCTVIHVDKHSDMRDPLSEGINCGTFLLAALLSDLPIRKVCWLYQPGFIHETSLAVSRDAQDRFCKRLSSQFGGVSVSTAGEATVFVFGGKKIVILPVWHFSSVMRDAASDPQVIVDIDLDTFVRSNGDLIPEIAGRSLQDVVDVCAANRDQLDIVTLCTSSDSGYFPSYFSFVSDYVENGIKNTTDAPPGDLRQVDWEYRAVSNTASAEDLSDALSRAATPLSHCGTLIKIELSQWLRHESAPIEPATRLLVQELPLGLRRTMGFGFFHDREGGTRLALRAVVNSLSVDPNNPFLIHKAAQLANALLAQFKQTQCREGTKYSLDDFIHDGWQEDPGLWQWYFDELLQQAAIAGGRNAG